MQEDNNLENLDNNDKNENLEESLFDDFSNDDSSNDNSSNDNSSNDNSSNDDSESLNDLKPQDVSEIEEDIPNQDFSNFDDELNENLQANTFVSTLDEEEKNETQDLITVRPVKFQEFEEEKINSAIKKNLDIMQDVIMHVSVEIGKTKSSIKDVMELKEGSIVELDKIAGEQVEIYVNEKLVAKGEVIVIEDKFGVRVTTTSLPKPQGII